MWDTLRSMYSTNSHEPTQQVKLSTVTVDLKCRDNGFMHHTRDYQLNAQGSALVVRRGASFKLSLQFNGDVTKFSNVALAISTDSFKQKRLERSWLLKQDDPAHNCPLQMTVLKSASDNKTISLQMVSKPDAVISKFNITKVVLSQAAPSQSVTLDAKGSIILIYNPFHIDDQVFMGVEKERHEFVMKDDGMLFQGLRNNRPFGRPWFFGQFDSPTLECTLLLLSKSQLAWEDWSDPVKVSRALSAVINSYDENGLLYGKWSDNYTGGRNPTEWTGSLKIFQEFHSSGGRPVRFGQCWVFSGCLTSAGRTLGIPTRSVTNYESAHDTNANLLIDRYFDVSGEIFKGKETEKYWNFHVWNEMWMKRPDLGDRYRGWQALDATPQEVSDGLVQTGPCPVTAIKEGEIKVAFDAAFIYAEVNACLKSWVTRDNGKTWTEERSNSKHVGKFISTKAVGSNERHDLTNLYKYDEGSRKEREVFERARQLALKAGGEKLPLASSNAQGGLRDADAKVWQLRVSDGPDAVHFGSDAVVKVAIKNLSDQERLGSCSCAVILVNYRGRQLKKLDACKLDLKLQAGEEIQGELVVKGQHYMDFGYEEISIMVTAILIESNNWVQIFDHIIGFTYPDLIFKIPPRVSRGSRTEIKLEMKNDLPKPLTGAKFLVEGPGLRTTDLEKQIDDVQSGGTATATFSLAFHRAGPVTLVASFSSKEMTGVNNQTSFYVDY